jgi:hypothetical protein
VAAADPVGAEFAEGRLAGDDVVVGEQDVVADGADRFLLAAKARRVEKLTTGPVRLATRYEAEFLKGDPTTIEFVRFERPLAWESVGRSRRLDAKGEGRVSATDDGARLGMRMELRPKGTLRLLLPIMARFMHKQEERNLAAIKAVLEGSGAIAARRGA